MLAIVIPAYKGAYLAGMLQSIANQSNKNFNVYIGNDASLEDLEEIIKPFIKKFPLFYKRFEQNIGSEKLVFQWQRCIELTSDEEWIWLFSDDDLMDTNCVENFYKTQQAYPQLEIFRFNTLVIDKKNQPLKHSPFGPEYETSEDMAYNLFLGKRGNSMPDHIFSRSVYKRFGGLVFTEYAQSADWAMSIKFSKDHGIVIIPGAYVHWRYSGINISSNAGKNRVRNINGYITFLKWAHAHFQYLKYQHHTISYDQMMTSLRTNFKLLFTYHYKGIPFRLMIPVLITLNKYLQITPYKSLLIILRINKSLATGNFVKRWKTIFGL